MEKGGIQGEKSIFIFFLFISIFNITSCEKTNNLEPIVSLNTNEKENIINEKEYLDEDLKLEDKKDISLSIEGIEENRIFKLLDDKSLPFITYVPENCDIVLEDNNTIISWKELSFVEILILPDTIDEIKALEKVESIVEKYSQAEKIEDKSSQWNTVYYMMTIPKNGETLKSGYVWLGEHSKRLFIIYLHIDNMEFGEILIPEFKAIFQEWIWKDTREGICDLFN